MEKQKFLPTEEQIFAVETAKRLEAMKISAFAGTGKTSTLDLIGQALAPRKGLYLAFNKVIATEAQTRMPSNVTAKTFHSLAYAHYGKPFGKRLSQRLNGTVIAEHLGLSPLQIRRDVTISAAAVGSHVLKIVQRFCRSLDEQITTRHVPDIDLVGLTVQEQAGIAAAFVDPARRLWRDMSDPKGRFPSSHDVYVKLWVDSCPVISGFDFLLFDEAQDADRLMLSVVQGQRIPTFFCGDRNQQIYAWRGAINAMETIETAHEAFLTTSFRFGQTIADEANCLLRTLGEMRPIVGNPAVESNVTIISKPDAILCRTNAEVVRQVMSAMRSKRTIAATGISEAIAFYEAAVKLKQGQRPSGALALFETWTQLVDYSTTDEGADLATYVRLADQYGVDEIMGMLNRVTDTSKLKGAAQLTISTAHRAKGMEWGAVRLAGDFKIPGGKREPNEEEIRLLYVAMTRAKTKLDISELPEKEDAAADAIRGTTTKTTAFPAVDIRHSDNQFPDLEVMENPKITVPASCVDRPVSNPAIKVKPLQQTPIPVRRSSSIENLLSRADRLLNKK